MIPNKLEKGDTIGIIAPSDSVQEKDVKEINDSITLMEASGFKIEFGKYVFSNSTGYGASAKEKAEDIKRMFQNPEIKAIFCVKGGSNSNTTFSYLDYDVIKENPKIICGFSDSTSLLNIITEKTGLITFHGPTFKSLTSWETEYGYREVIKRFVEGKLELGEKEDEYQVIQEGVAEGKLVGGNLGLFSRLIGAKYSVDIKDKILFLEETGFEADPAMVSNYIYFLDQNDVFKNITGIWLGNYEHSSRISIEKILKDSIEDKYNFPIIKSNNFGHTDKKTVIPIGTKAKIDTRKNVKIELLENCVKNINIDHKNKKEP